MIVYMYTMEVKIEYPLLYICMYVWQYICMQGIIHVYKMIKTFQRFATASGTSLLLNPVGAFNGLQPLLVLVTAEPRRNVI
jgi:hypothetical protein